MSMHQHTCVQTSIGTHTRTLPPHDTLALYCQALGVLSYSLTGVMLILRGKVDQERKHHFHPSVGARAFIKSVTAT